MERQVKKVWLVKATYACETLTMRKSERTSLDAFEHWCWRRLLRIFRQTKEPMHLLSFAGELC